MCSKDHEIDIIMWWASHWEWTHYVPQQMAKQFSRNHRVLLINIPPILIKSLTPRRFKQFIRELLGSIKGPRRVGEKLWVHTPLPLVIPYGHIPVIDVLGKLLSWLEVKWRIKKLNFKGKVWCIYNPFYIWLRGLKNASKDGVIIYDILDEWPSISSKFPWKRSYMRRVERKLASLNAIFIACSLPLKEKKSRELKARTFFLPPGVDIALYKKALDPHVSIPDDVKKIKKPIIGYIGTMSNMKIDWELIHFLALKRSEWSFVFIGPIADRISPEICNLGNIFFLGRKPIDTLPSYLKAFDVAIIPFRQNTFGQFAFPTKVFEYLSSGKPIVSTNLPALRGFHPLIRIGEDKHQFLKLIEEALAEKGEYFQERVNLAHKHTWENRAIAILNIIKEFLHAKKPFA